MGATGPAGSRLNSVADPVMASVYFRLEGWYLGSAATHDAKSRPNAKRHDPA